MSEFAIVHSKLAPLSDDQIAKAKWASRVSRDPTLTLEPKVWNSKSERILLVSWGVTNKIGSWDGSHIAEWEDHALTVSGFVYSDEFTTPLRLGQALAAATDRDAIIAKLGGSFTIGFCDGPSGRFSVWSTVCGYPNAVYLRRRDIDLATTRPSFAAVMASSDAWPRYDGNGLGRFIALGCSSTEQTVFADVEHLPGNAGFHSGVAGVTISNIDSDLDAVGESRQVPAERDFDDAAQIFLDGVRTLVSGARGTRFGLSGGKDSRLIAAAIHHGGFGAEAACHDNWADHPDLVLGRRIAEVLELNCAPIRIIAKQDEEFSFEVDVDHYLFGPLRDSDCRRISPMGNPVKRPRAMESLAVRFQILRSHATTDRIAESVTLSGTGGEIARGGFAMKSFLGEDAPSVDRIKAMMRTYLLGSSEFLLPTHRQSHDAWFDDWYTKNKCIDFPLAIFEKFYVFVLMNRTMSPLRRANEFSPFTDQRLVKHVFKFELASRRNELFHLEMLRRFAPELVDVPLAVHRWGFEHSGPRRGDERGYAARIPLQHRVGSSSSYAVRYTAGTDLRGFFERSFLHNHRHLLETVIDYEKLNAFLRSEASYEDTNAGIFWTLHAGALVASNRWIDPLEALYQQHGLVAPRQIIRLDAPWNVVDFWLHRAGQGAWDSVCRSLETGPVDMESLYQAKDLDRLLSSREFMTEAPAKAVAGPELLDGKWRILPEPERVEHGAARSETTNDSLAREVNLSVVPKPRQNTWFMLSLGRLSKLAGKALRLSFEIRTSPPGHNIFYIADRGVILHESSLRTNEAWTAEAVSFHLPSFEDAAAAVERRSLSAKRRIPTWFRPRAALRRLLDPYIVEAWFPVSVESRQSEFGLRNIVLEEGKESEGVDKLERAARRTLAFGSLFRGEFLNISRVLATRFGMSEEQVGKHFATLLLDAPHGAMPTTLQDVSENTLSWQSFQLGWLRQTLLLERPASGKNSPLLRAFRQTRASINRHLLLQDRD